MFFRRRRDRRQGIDLRDRCGRGRHGRRARRRRRDGWQGPSRGGRGRRCRGRDGWYGPSRGGRGRRRRRRPRRRRGHDRWRGPNRGCRKSRRRVGRVRRLLDTHGGARVGRIAGFTGSQEQHHQEQCHRNPQAGSKSPHCNPLPSRARRGFPTPGRSTPVASPVCIRSSGSLLRYRSNVNENLPRTYYLLAILRPLCSRTGLGREDRVLEHEMEQQLGASSSRKPIAMTDIGSLTAGRRMTHDLE